MAVSDRLISCRAWGALSITVWRLSPEDSQQRRIGRWLDLSDRVSVESGLSMRGAQGEEVEEEAMRLFVLAFGGFKEAAQHRVVFQTPIIPSSCLHLRHLRTVRLSRSRRL
jgi:hypothetical protein